MTYTKAVNRAASDAEYYGKAYAVVEALPNELEKGFYSEPVETAPVSQRVLVITPEMARKYYL